MKLRQGVAMTTTEYGAVLLDERSGSYWQLNECGAIVVDALAQGRGREAAVERLLEEYDVGRAEAEADVAELTGRLVEAELLAP
ncbi:lasso peptide biosynthesis PqqD family chaperone [Streptomyces verrucosisporus]|uniref:lasso peptide biosynthesis PqqD family chaperone n=1 Tax=Streptomyces verrucosisporus TaxID=1695161 RepID=UPI0019D2AB54|nr:lasso peptide biosynthesis PqqD family chaperone [Streptomyces verrucosisporus]MBN3932578.1 lasso peptide biosynthesis PqqD family chaperone [Streptomyces verrucosisporus]